MATQKLRNNSVGKDMKRTESLYNTGGTVNWVAVLGRRMEITHKIKNRKFRNIQ